MEKRHTILPVAIVAALFGTAVRRPVVAVAPHDTPAQSAAVKAAAPVQPWLWLRFRQSLGRMQVHAPKRVVRLPCSGESPHRSCLSHLAMWVQS